MATQTKPFKPGQKVETRHFASGEGKKGKVVALHNKSNGPWVEVDLGDKKNPLLGRFRPAHLVHMGR